MKIKYWIAALGVAAAAVALPASAQMTRPALSSAYIGGSIGQADADIDCEGAPCDTKDTAWRFFGGYQFNRSFAVELGYSQFGEASIDFAPGDRIVAEATAWDLSLVGALPLGPVSLFGRIGLFNAETEINDSLFGTFDDNSTGLTWGIGLQYDFNRNLGLRVEWQQYKDIEVEDTKFDVNVLNLGIVWRFQ